MYGRSRRVFFPCCCRFFFLLLLVAGAFSFTRVSSLVRHSEYVCTISLILTLYFVKMRCCHRNTCRLYLYLCTFVHGVRHFKRGHHPIPSQTHPIPSHPPHTQSIRTHVASSLRSILLSTCRKCQSKWIQFRDGNPNAIAYRVCSICCLRRKYANRRTRNGRAHSPSSRQRASRLLC